VRNTPVAVYLGCMGLFVGSIGLVMSSSRPAVERAAPSEPVWPPSLAAVPYNTEMTQLLTYESDSAGRAAREAYARASEAQAARELEAAREQEAAKPREVVRDAASERKRKNTRNRQRDDEERAEVVVRDSTGVYRSARVPREQDMRRGYAPEDRGFGPLWGRW